MKQKLLAFLASISIIGSVTGCSTNELAYLEMSQEIIGHTGIVEASGNINISLNAEDTVYLVQSMRDIAKKPSIETIDKLSNFSSFKNQYDLVFKYSTSFDPNTLSYDIQLSSEYNSVHFNLGNIYFSEVNGWSISGDTVVGFTKLYNYCSTDYETYLGNAEFFTALENAVKPLGIINLKENEKYIGNNYSNNYSGQELINYVVEFYTSAFSGLHTRFVTPIENGFAVNFTGNEIVNSLYTAINYTNISFSQVHKAFAEYIVNVAELTNMPNNELQEIVSLLSYLNQSDIEKSKVYLTSIRDSLQETFSTTKATSILDNSNYSSNLTKNENNFKLEEELTVKNNNGGNVLTYSNSAEIVLSDKNTISIPQATTSKEQLLSTIQSVTASYSPVTDITLLWAPYSGDTVALLTEMRGNPLLVPFASESYSVEYLIHENSMYAPLRAVSEGLGEEVSWDATTKTAYIIKADGTSIPMTGIIINGTTMLKIRDFEKLDYIVSYEELDNNVRKATVSQPK